MTTRQTPRSASPSGEADDVSERTTIPSSAIGVTLRISDEALKKLDQMQEETIKAAQEDQKFSWR